MTDFSKNVPDDWGNFTMMCYRCEKEYHQSEGHECDLPIEEYMPDTAVKLNEDFYIMVDIVDIDVMEESITGYTLNIYYKEDDLVLPTETVRINCKTIDDDLMVLENYILTKEDIQRVKEDLDL